MRLKFAGVALVLVASFTLAACNDTTVAPSDPQPVEFDFDFDKTKTKTVTAPPPTLPTYRPPVVTTQRTTQRTTQTTAKTTTRR